MSEQPGNDTTVDDLLFRYLEASGDQPADAVLDELCQAAPELAGELRALVRTLDETGLSEPASQDRTLGPYRLLRRLGSGGMGVVYLAEDQRGGARVALKVVRPEQLFFESARERFRRETEAVARLSHPSIVRVLECGEHEGVPYLVQEHVMGMSLEAILQAFEGRDASRLAGSDLYELLAGPGERPRDPFPGFFEGGWARVCARIAAAAADALAHAHVSGILHRDVKPSNLLVTPEGRVVLVDFGLASIAESDALTRTGSILGSLPYLAPEVLDGARATALSDVYSLGVTLYELVTFSRPFGARQPDELRRQILEGNAARPSLRNSAVVRDLDTLIGCAIDRGLGRRYGSAEALAADLRAHLAGRAISKKPPGPIVWAKRQVRRRPAAAATALTGALALTVAPLVYGVLQARHVREVEALNLDLASALAGQRAATSAAEANFDLALGTVEHLLEQFSDDALDEYPALAPLRLQAIDRALATFETLRSENTVERDLLMETALAYRARGDALYELRRMEEALQAQLRQVEMLQELAAAADERDESTGRLWQEVGIGHSRVARTLGPLGRAPEAVLALERATEWAERAVQRAPDVVEHQLALVSHWTNLALNLADANRIDEARTRFERVIERAMELAAAVPDDVRVHGVLARAWLQRSRPPLAEAGDAARLEGLSSARSAVRVALSLEPRDRQLRDTLNRIDLQEASALVHLGDLDVARETLEDCVAASEALALEFPVFPEYRDCLLDAAELLAHVARLQGDWEFARATMRDGADWSEEHAAAHGDDVLIMGSTRARFVNLANVYINSPDLGLERFELALEALERAQAWHARVLERGTFGEDDATFRFHMLYNACVVLSNLGRTDEAEAKATELSRETDSDPWACRLVADAWCEVLNAEARGAAAQGDESPRLARARTEALRWLQGAIDAGYRDRSELDSTPALERLRADQRFRAMLESMRRDAD